MYDYEYSLSDAWLEQGLFETSFRDIEKELNEAAQTEEHNERRPRSTKYATTSFYNFPRKKNKRRGKK